MALKMKLFSAVGDFFALDIGTSAIRMVQLSKSGNGWSFDKYAYVPIDIKTSTADSQEGQRRLSEFITTAIGQSGISSRNVVLGIPSNKMFATVVDLPDMSKQEIGSTIKYQAEQFIPMSVEDSKIDWAVLGKSPNNPAEVEVLLASVGNAFVESRLDIVEGLGLNVIAIEPDSLALTRAILPSSATASEALVIVDVGDFATDLVVAYGDAPRLVRSIPVGFQSLVKAASQNLNVQDNQAVQFLMKFGLAPDRLEGQVVRAIEGTLEQYVSEIVKSVKFFQTRYPSVQVNTMVLTGYGASLPQFAEYSAAKTGLKAGVANPLQRVTISQSDQAKLQPVLSQFSVALGLAEREGDS
jgi:type IV pilus assembly protein PilM